MWFKFSNYIGGGERVLFRGLSETYLSCYNLLQFLYYQRINNRLKTVVPVLSCGALERSNNSYIELKLEPRGFNNQKEIFAMWVWLGRKSWRRTEAIEKSIHKFKVEFEYLCVGEKKNNRFEITVIILRYTKNVNLLFKQDFKIAKLLTKTSFFLYFRDRPKNGERNKGDVESICAKVTKRIKKCGLNLTWINYEQFIMNGFDCIFISTNNLAYLIPILMFSLVSWFLYFL